MPGILFPKEHGALAMFFVPLFIGLAVSGEWRIPSLLLVGAASFGYLARYPAALLLTTRRKVLGWAIFYTSFASLFSFPLIVSYNLYFLFAFAAFFLLSFIVHLVFSKKGLARSLLVEFFSIAALSSTSAVAHYVGTGRLEFRAFVLWTLCFLYFGESVFYVRLKAAGSNQAFLGTLSYALASFALVLSLSIGGVIPSLCFLAFLPVTVKSVSGAFESEKMNIRKIGFIEAGHSVLFACLLVSSYAL